MSAHPHPNGTAGQHVWVNQTHIKAQSNSWYLRTGEVHNFFCKCGRIDQYHRSILSLEHHPSHRCSKCGNGYYIDVVAFRYSRETKIFKAFHWDVEYTQNGSYWDVTYTVMYPTFDYQLQKIVMHKDELMYANLDPSSFFYEPLEYTYLEKSVYNDEKRPLKIRVHMERAVKESLLQFVQESQHATVAWLKEIPAYRKIASTEEKLRTIALFLQYDFKDFDLYYWRQIERFRFGYADETVWGTLYTCFAKPAKSLEEVLLRVCNDRKERSVKRALFSAYQEAIEKKLYDPLPDMVFSRMIDDPNLLVRLILIPSQIKQRMFERLALNSIEPLFTILHLWYNDRQIVRLFESITVEQIEEGMVWDTWRMLREEGVVWQLQQDFPKPAANMRAVHDAFVVARHRVSVNESFDAAFAYPDYALKAQTTVEGLRFALPQTHKELNLWSNWLHNCMFSYAREISQQQTLIYGVFAGEELLYAVEVRAGKIVQQLGKYNKRIGEEHRRVISTWKKRYWGYSRECINYAIFQK